MFASNVHFCHTLGRRLKGEFYSRLSSMVWAKILKSEIFNYSLRKHENATLNTKIGSTHIKFSSHERLALHSYLLAFHRCIFGNVILGTSGQQILRPPSSRSYIDQESYYSPLKRRHIPPLMLVNSYYRQGMFINVVIWGGGSTNMDKFEEAVHKRRPLLGEGRVV